MSTEMKPDTMTLTSTSGIGNEVVVMKAEIAELPLALDLVERFLRASGFYFEGSLSILTEDDINLLATANQ